MVLKPPAICIVGPDNINAGREKFNGLYLFFPHALEDKKRVSIAVV